MLVAKDGALVVVQMDVSRGRLRVREPRRQCTRNGRVADIQGQSEAAEIEVSRRREVRVAGEGHVLNDDRAYRTVPAARAVR